MLWFVPVPIGNLEDITLRSLRLLKELKIFFVEDTRTFKSLLAALKIPFKDKKIYSFHSFSSETEAKKIIALAAEQDIWVVSEAWTPWLSDPWKQLIRLAYANDVKFSILPWPNALIPAVVAACFDTHQFVFWGFFPAKKWVKKTIKFVIQSQLPVFFFESVHRLQKHLKMFLEEWFDRKVFVWRELTKKYEQLECQNLEIIVKKIEDWQIPLKGEFVIGFEGKKPKFSF